MFHSCLSTLFQNAHKQCSDAKLYQSQSVIACATIFGRRMSFYMKFNSFKFTYSVISCIFDAGHHYYLNLKLNLSFDHLVEGFIP